MIRIWIPTALAAAVVAGGCPTVDLGEAPVAPGDCRPDEGYYRDVVWPEYLAPGDPDRSCVGEGGCHGEPGARSALRLVAGESLSDADHRANYDVVTNFLSCGDPETSALLTKPLAGRNPHEGGALFEPESEPYELFIDWFDL